MSLPVTNKWQSLVKKLITLTYNNAIFWRDEGGSEYRTEIAKRTVSVRNFRDFDGSINIIFTIYKDSEYGTLTSVDTFNDDDLPEIPFTELEEFTRYIHRQSTGADKEIDDLLSDLGEIEEQFTVENL